MKRFLLLFIFILLAGCNPDSEGEMTAFAEKQIKENYGVQVKVTSIIPQGKIGDPVVTLMEDMVNPKLYYLEFEPVTGSKFTFMGSITEDLEDFRESYIESKHKYSVSTNQEYKRKSDILIQNGFKDVKVMGYQSKEDKVIVEYLGLYSGQDSNSEEMTNALFEMTDELTQQPYEVIVKFESDPTHSDGYFYQVSTSRFDETKKQELAVVLEEQFEFVVKHNLVENEINQKIESLDLTARSNLFKEHNQSFPEDLITKHEINLTGKGTNLGENVHAAFEMLNEAGLYEAIVDFILDGEHKSCTVKQVQAASDLNRCDSKL